MRNLRLVPWCVTEINERLRAGREQGETERKDKR